MDTREFDLVLFGASGFAGRLLARHVAAHAPAGLRVALAGRSAKRLAAVREELPAPGNAWPVVAADALDASAVAGLARRTLAVATTVGPYARYGTALVAACAAAGTHYADLTGEVLFMRRSIEANHALARGTGARIVHACGFDSVPADLGVWLVHRHAQATGAGGLTRVTGLLTGAGGGVSGGTIDSMRAQFAELREDPAARRMVGDPHALDIELVEPVGRPGPPDRWDLHWDGELGYWLAPFVMAPLNTRVVRRSQALLAGGYGAGFRYREAVGVKGHLAGALPAAAVAVVTAGFGAAMSWPPTQRLLDRVLPAPGEGPSAKAMAAGYFRFHVLAETESGRMLEATVGADLDPGYGATAVMLAESALALAAGDGSAAGVLTPAVALGDALVERLRTRGFAMSVTERA